MAERSVSLKLGTKLDSSALSSFNKIEKKALGIKKLLKDAFNVSKFIGVGLAGAGLAFLTVGTRNAISFERAMAEVSTLVDTTKVNMEELSEAALGVSSATGVEAVQIAKALYKGLSSGATDAANSINFLDKAVRLSIAGISSVEESVAITTNIMNAYGKESLSVAEIQDILFKTVEQGVTTLGELSVSVGAVLPFATKLGIGIKELFAAIDTLTKGGLSTSSAMTFLGQAFQTIIRSEKKVFDVTKDLKFEFSAVAVKTKGFIAFLKELEVATSKTDLEIKDLFRDGSALAAILGLTGDKAQVLAADFEGLNNATGSAEVGFQKMQESLKFDIIINEFKNASIQIGQEFLPIITDAMGVLSQTFKDLNEDGSIDQATTNLTNFATDAAATFLVLQAVALDIGAAIGGTLEFIAEQAIGSAGAILKLGGTVSGFLGFETAAFAFTAAGTPLLETARDIRAGSEERQRSARVRSDELFLQGQQLVARGDLANRQLQVEESNRARDRGIQNGTLNADVVNQAIETTIIANNQTLEEKLRKRRAGDESRAP